ncbi:MAG: hypothetical protein ACYDDF_01645 [Thermoplasmatota archaeon]
MAAQIEPLLTHPDYTRALALLREKGALRFGEIQKGLGANPTQVDRALKFLRKGLWVIPETEASGPRVVVRYSLGKRGAAFLASFDAMVKTAERHRDVLGEGAVEELAALSR